jgi:hypothetical protein
LFALRLEALANEPASRRARLEELDAFYAWWQTRLPTLLAPTAGRALVLGHDVVTEPLAVRRRIGLAGQFAAVDAELTGRENVEMIARLYRLPHVEATKGRRCC